MWINRIGEIKEEYLGKGGLNFFRQLGNRHKKYIKTYYVNRGPFTRFYDLVTIVDQKKNRWYTLPSPIFLQIMGLEEHSYENFDDEMKANYGYTDIQSLLITKFFDIFITGAEWEEIKDRMLAPANISFMADKQKQFKKFGIAPNVNIDLNILNNELFSTETKIGVYDEYYISADGTIDIVHVNSYLEENYETGEKYIVEREGDIKAISAEQLLFDLQYADRSNNYAINISH